MARRTASVVASVATMISILFSSSPVAEAYGARNKAWWEGAGAAEQAKATTSGMFQTQTDMARDGPDGGRVAAAFKKKDEALLSKREKNAQIAARASVSTGTTWWDSAGSPGYGGTAVHTNGFLSHTDRIKAERLEQRRLLAQQRGQLPAASTGGGTSQELQQEVAEQPKQELKQEEAVEQPQQEQVDIPPEMEEAEMGVKAEASPAQE